MKTSSRRAGTSLHSEPVSRLSALGPSPSTFDACRADVIHRAGGCAPMGFVVPGLSVVPDRLLDMDLQAPPGDAVGRVVGSGGEESPPRAARWTTPSSG